MPHICHIYQLLHVHISDNCGIYTLFKLSAINNITTSTGILTFALLAYAPEQICLLNEEKTEFIIFGTHQQL